MFSKMLILSYVVAQVLFSKINDEKKIIFLLNILSNTCLL
jgi:hypothetical protein